MIKRNNETSNRYTYMDCLRGTVPLPKHVNGATLFQVLMVGGMVTFMVTVNGLRNTGLDFLVNSHWLYPLMFCLAFLFKLIVIAGINFSRSQEFLILEIGRVHV